ncbi:MAG: TonB-dependent receptor [Cyclobacteriaceae bacterium]|nr:TonB-dependent receptor [Cyclobacteriaceae bacterium]
MKTEAQVKSIKDVKVSVDFKEVQLKKAFLYLEKETGFHFTFNDLHLRSLQSITLDKKNASLAEILLDISKQSKLHFRQINNTITVKPLPEGEKLDEIEIEQAITITGRVTSSDSPDGLPGVNVVVKGTNQGTITDINGNYNIEVPGTSTILVFSSVGYLTEEVTVGNRSIINLSMTTDITALEEIVVVGYGTQKLSDVTGSVVRANIDAFRESPNVNIAQSLQGTVPGLNIGQVNSAGQNPDISVRGRTTISGNQNVLIVVDGIIFMGALSDLNPNDIQSIDVLKDASSMAIFGAQAANGVIMITTKAGKMEQKPIFNYTGTVTSQSPTNVPRLYDRDGFLNKVRDQDWQTSFLPPDYLQPNPNYDVGENLEPELYRGYLDGTDFNWWDAGIQTGYITSHNLSVRGANKETSYFVSTGYTKQEGYILNDQFERITARINLEHQVLDGFRFGVQTFGSFSDYSGEIPAMNRITGMSPLLKPYDENGNLILNPDGGQRENPFLTSYSNDFDKRNNLFANVYMDIDVPFITGLNYRINFGNNYSWRRHYRSNIYGANAAGEAFKRNYHAYDWTLDNIITYKRKIFDNHRIDITLVAGRRELSFEDTRADGSNYNNLILGYNDLSLGQLQLIRSGAWDESYLYQTARLNYDIGGKYLFTGTIRRDGFSGFAENRKFGVFPSLGFGWILSEESFINQEWIHTLKLRGSYGKNGNLTNRYSSLARVAFYPAYVFGDGGSTAFGQRVTTLSNADLSWETTVGYNFGLDFSFLGSRLSGSIDYYENTTNDLLFDVNIPQITGFTSITTNVGNIDNRGIEIILRGDVIQKSDFNWNVNFNLASNRNRIVSLLGIDSDGDGIEDDLIGSNLFIGQSINSIFTYESSGIIQLGEEEPPGYFVGTHRIVDQNGDGIIDPFDRVIIGREEPAYSFGILNEFNYKNFTFRFFINSIQGGRNGYLGLNHPNMGQADQVRRRNLFQELDYWSPSNPNATYRAQDRGAAIEFLNYADRSFIRLQDVTLAYRVNSNLIEKFGLSSMKAFVSAKNLATWTNWVGFDPETGSGLDQSGLPVLRGISIGLDVSF